MLDHTFSADDQLLIKELEKKGLRVDFSEPGGESGNRYCCRVTPDDGTDPGAIYGETPEHALHLTYSYVTLQWEA